MQANVSPDSLLEKMRAELERPRSTAGKTTRSFFRLSTGASTPSERWFLREGEFKGKKLGLTPKNVLVRIGKVAIILMIAGVLIGGLF